MSEDWFAGISPSPVTETPPSDSSDDWFASVSPHVKSPLEDRTLELRAQIAKEQAAAQAGTPIPTVGDPTTIPSGIGAQLNAGRLGYAGSLFYGVPAAITDLQAAALKKMGAPERVVQAAEKVAAEKKSDYEAATTIPGMVATAPQGTAEEVARALPGSGVALLGYLAPGVGPVLGSVLAGAPTFGDTYMPAVARGENRAKAGGIATLNAVGQALLERLGGAEAAALKKPAAQAAREVFLELAKEGGLKRFAKRVGMSALSETGEEELQQLLDLNSRFALGEFEGKTPTEIAKQYVSELWQSGKVASILGGGLAAPVHGARGVVESVMIDEFAKSQFPNPENTKTADALRAVTDLKNQVEDSALAGLAPAIDLQAQLNEAQNHADRVESAYRKANGFEDETLVVKNPLKPTVIEQGGAQPVAATNPSAGLPLSGVANEGTPLPGEETVSLLSNLKKGGKAQLSVPNKIGNFEVVPVVIESIGKKWVKFRAGAGGPVQALPMATFLTAYSRAQTPQEAAPTLLNGGILDTTDTVAAGRPVEGADEATLPIEGANEATTPLAELSGTAPWDRTVGPESTAVMPPEGTHTRYAKRYGIAAITRTDVNPEGYVSEALKQDTEAALEQIRRNKAMEMVGEEAGKAVARGVDPTPNPKEGVDFRNAMGLIFALADQANRTHSVDDVRAFHEALYNSERGLGPSYEAIQRVNAAMQDLYEGKAPTIPGGGALRIRGAILEQVRSNKAMEMVGEEAGKAVARGVDPTPNPMDGEPDPGGAGRLVDGATDAMEETLHGFAGEQELVLQAREALTLSEAIFGGDASGLKPELLAQARTDAMQRVESLKAKLQEALRGIYGAAEVAKSTVQTRAQAVASIKALRQRALQAAIQLGDPRAFDRADEEYRHLLDALERQQGPNQPSPEATPQRTLADALSEYRDAVVAAIPRVERQAIREWGKHAREGTLPINPETGGPRTKEELKAAKVLVFQQNANRIFEEISKMGTDEAAMIRAADARLAQLLKEHKISPNSVGFRGNADLQRRSDMDAAVDELRVLLYGAEGAADPAVKTSLTRYTTEQLTDLARRYTEDAKASLTGQPNPGVLQFIQNELARRLKNEPPSDINPLANTEEFNKQTIARLASVVPDAALKSLTGQPITDAERARMTIWDKLANLLPNFTATAIGQGMSGLGVKPNWAVAHVGPSLTTMLAPLASMKQKIATAKLMMALKHGSKTLRDSLMQDSARIGAVLDDAIAAHIRGQREQGVMVDKGLLYIQIGDAYMGGDLSSLDPNLQEVLKKEVIPFLNSFQKRVAEFATTPELKAKIYDSMNRYLFRDYAIFHDEDAFYKTVLKDSPEVRQQVDKLLSQTSDKMFADLYRAKAPDLRNQGMDEAQIVEVIQALIPEHAEALVQSAVKAHLKNPLGKSSEVPWIQKARLDYFKRRVIDDPVMRKIMGEQRHFGYALQHTIELMATDIARYQFNTGLVDILRGAGLLGDTKIGQLETTISKDGLVPIGASDTVPESGVYYVTPQVNAVMGAWHTGSNQAAGIFNRVISTMKSLMILAPAGFLQNVESIPQTVMTGMGLVRSMTRITDMAFGPKDNRAYARTQNVLAWNLMREFLMPGKGLISLKESALKGKSSTDQQMMEETGAWLDEHVAKIGMTPRQFSTLVTELQRAGLDTGGEWAFELGTGNEPLLDQFKGRERVGVFGRFFKTSGEIYRAADVLSKVMVYQNEISQLRWKAGYDAKTPGDVPSEGASDEIRALAAERALRMTQNPETTPDIIRNFSRGALGLVTFNFGGFFYQMARNYAWSHIYGAQDLIQASILHGKAERLRGEGDLVGAAEAAKIADRHMWTGTDRMAGAAASMFMATALFKGAVGALYSLFDKNDDNEERKQHIAYVRPYTQNRYEDFMVFRYWKGKDGRYYAAVQPTGRTDIYDGMKQYYRALTDPNLSPIDRVKTASEIFRDQYLSASAIVQGLVAMGTKDTAMEQVGVIFDRMAGQGARFAYRILKDVNAIANYPPRDPRLPQAKGVENKEVADIVYQVTRQAGFAIKIEPVTSNLVSRYKQTWASNQSWLKELTKDYNVATPTQRLKLVADSKDKWEKMMATFDTHNNHAYGLSHKAPMLRELLKNETQIPDYVANGIVYGGERSRPSLELYLNSQASEFTKKMTRWEP